MMNENPSSSPRDEKGESDATSEAGTSPFSAESEPGPEPSNDLADSNADNHVDISQNPDAEQIIDANMVGPAEGEWGSEKSADNRASGSTGEPIRYGSPFADDPFAFQVDRPIEAFYDVGPLKYTAMGAVSASALVLCFAIAAAFVFPTGGTLITALGCVLSIFGMYSSFRLTAAALLAGHLCLFVVCYGRAVM